jgi:hypothetical protein
MSKTIRVTTSSGDIRVRVSNETELDRVLMRNNATCLVDEEQIQIYGFDSLEHDGSYTYGPVLVPAPVAQPQQPHQDISKSFAVKGLRKRASAKKVTNEKKKGGAKKGSKRNDKPQAFWYQLCQKHENSKTKWKSQMEFLRSEESGPEVGEDHKMSFSRALNKYREGRLANVKESRVHDRQYEAVERTEVEHLDPAEHAMPIHPISNKRTSYASPSILSFFGSSSSS